MPAPSPSRTAFVPGGNTILLQGDKPQPGRMASLDRTARSVNNSVQETLMGVVTYPGGSCLMDGQSWTLEHQARVNNNTGSNQTLNLLIRTPTEIIYQTVSGNIVSAANDRSVTCRLDLIRASATTGLGTLTWVIGGAGNITTGTGSLLSASVSTMASPLDNFTFDWMKNNEITISIALTAANAAYTYTHRFTRGFN